ncbi:hypothetical protein PCC7424_4249 [Gloeothece citriformis PCC 7424]|uniref:O-methyltransferase-like protein n=1 Tax=Gloeothece citriformis (strain PCC 7424) TaxID=65393 RepID=B7K6S0_GLOC7|nr:class I SAM-dependent methyltransferase [Gloeothece citriformis]ACK72619.1 hypothetical protein PCC7424_4249 [Gloeothece citriformis PCC 7424]
MIMTQLEKFWQLFQRPQKKPESSNFNISLSETHENLEKLIADNPKFHSLNGVPTSWSIQTDTLRFLYSLLKPGMVTLETGCGQTTVVFAIAGTKHICIMPDAEEANRVKQYCGSLACSNPITFLINSSDILLPCSDQIPKELDFVFIDGAHAFPAPIIDWHYTAGKLKIGGTMCVDDYKMPSVKILFDFLCNEDEWELITIVQNTAFFKKLKNLKNLADWTGQNINKDFPGY